MGGVAGKIYLATLQIRGEVEQRTYTGGSNDGSFWQIGGDEPTGSDVYNVYSLDVSSPLQKYFLNRGTSAQGYCTLIGYEKTIQVGAAGTLRLAASPVDTCEIVNRDANGHPIVVPGVPPDPAAFNGQFVQVDLISISEQ